MHLLKRTAALSGKRKNKTGRKRVTNLVRKPKTTTKREGAGRPSLHQGKDLTRHVTGYLTPEGWEKLAEVQGLLLEEETTRPDLKSISVSDALEEGIHRLHKELKGG